MEKNMRSCPGKTSAAVLVLLAGILIAVVALTLVLALKDGRGAGQVGPSTQPKAKPKPLADGQTQTRAEMVSKGAKPASPSRPIDTGRIAAAYRPGSTYRTVVNITISGRGSNKDWGIEEVVNMHDLGEVEYLRKIESNDGQTMVMTLEFPKARNLSINTKSEGIRLDLGPRALTVLDGLGVLLADQPIGQWVKVATPAINEAADNPWLKDVMTQAAQDKAAKCFAFVDGIQGKKARVKYVNGEGVTEITPLGCSLDDDQRNLITGMSLASDVYILPNLECKPGDTWTVEGVDMLPLLDPSLHATMAGQITVKREEDAGQGASRLAVIGISQGTLELDNWDANSEAFGRWTPRGQMRFSFSDQIVTQAELTGAIQVEKRSTNHVFFEARQTVKPTYKVTYSCEVKK
jgi:hypothetical protein